MTVPCRGCPDRVPDPNCHATCERYLAYRAERDEMCRRRAEERAIQDTRNKRRQRAYDNYVKRKMAR